MSDQVTYIGPAEGLGRSPSPAAARVAAALAQLRDRIDSPRALVLRAEQRAAIERAADRVAAQLMGEAERVLTIALAGGSGVGKSTIINALAGATIAEAAEQRPCTMQATIYHHRDVPDGGLPVDLASQARTVVHDRPELRFKVVVDTPDLDTFATQNRLATRSMLKAAGLVLYVFTPEKYWDERVWSVIREEQRFSACLAILNKSDTVQAASLDRAAEEIRRRFAELGKPDIAVLRVAAGLHTPGASERPSTAIDEFPTLRAYIEHELHEGDIARMRREQRLRVVEHLGHELESALPAETPAKLDAVHQLAEAKADDASDRLAPVLSDAVFALEAELRPTIALRRHQLFTGPFRLWLAVGDFLTYSLPAAVRRLKSLAPTAASLDALLSFETHEALEQADRTGDAALRDALFSYGLPVEHWRLVVAETTGPTIPRELTREVQNRFESVAARSPGRVRFVARVASALGIFVPVALAGYALVAILRRLLTSQPTGGLDMLGLVFSLTVLSYVVLHSITALALWGTQPRPAPDLAKQCTRSVFCRRFSERVARYRHDLDEDLRLMREPVETLRALAESRPDPAASVAPTARTAPTLAIAAVPIISQVSSDAITAPVDAEESASISQLDAHVPTPAEPAAQPTEPTDESRTALRPAEIFRQAVERHASKG